MSIHIEAQTLCSQHMDFKDYSVVGAIACYLDLMDVGGVIEISTVRNKWGDTVSDNSVRQAVSFVGKRLGKKFAVSIDDWGEFKVSRLK